mgnify:CR=1 FL=1
MKSFSTLYGSKWVATIALLLCQFIACSVSVPSTGRSGLQQSKFDRPLLLKAVSVPSTGRSGLQPLVRRPPSCLVVVSVPSTGRSGLQPYRIITSHRVLSCFSTLYGSKWVATEEAAMLSHLASRFQYPLRVEVGCNT